MPMSNELKSGKIQPLNLSLYSDYKPETTLKGLGFKDKEKAIYTLNAIKGRDTKYQVNVTLSTMLGRAKKHPNKTPEMDDAILVLRNGCWIIRNQKIMLISIVNTPILQPVTHTNYIHLSIPPWLMRGVRTLKVLHISVLIKGIIST